MNHAVLRFYGELNDLLPLELRQRAIGRWFEGVTSVKDLIESCGVPHTEVALVLVGGTPADWSSPVADGARVAVFPRFCALALPESLCLQPLPQPEPRFVLDMHLGRLAGYLRLAGFDAAYSNRCADEELAEISRREDRVLLTRDRELLKRNIIERGYWVRATQPRLQLREIVHRFELAERMAPFTRCGRCNALLHPATRDEVLDRLPPRVRVGSRTFAECPVCRRVYWEGTHVDAIRRFLAMAVADSPAS